MVDRQSLEDCLEDLVKNYDSKIARTSIETLLTIHRNILHNEDVVTYRIIKPENSVFNKKVWSLLPCRQFMIMSGWIEAQNKLVFNYDERLIDTIEVLLNHRIMIPEESEWKAENKIIVENEESVRDQELKRKGALEREKELAAFAKEKKYREDLAKQIRGDILADKERRQALHNSQHKGQPAYKGPNYKF